MLKYIIVYLLGLCVGIVVGLITTNTIRTDKGNIGWNRDLTIQEKAHQFVTAETLPGKVTIYFDPAEDITKRVPGAYAYAQVRNDGTCTIHFPTKQKLHAITTDEWSAKWVKEANNETWAHELLHCFVSRWHV
jgi:hypothetical protein